MNDNQENKSEEEWLLQLVEQKSNVMYRLVYNMLCNSADTEDVVSTAILKAWENRKKLYQSDKAGSWLVRVAMNEAGNIYRARKRLNITDSMPQQEIVENQNDILRKQLIFQKLHFYIVMKTRHFICQKMN